ncbi:MAG: SLBB domain-containing protein [Bacteroidaceae bacterium]|nr:SLBB domain-containing protein [Bacteroidaceae bacterium]
MRRFLSILALLMLMAAPAAAQSMSDDDIIEFARKEKKKGSSDQQIVTDLVQRGVSVTKLQQLRRRLERENKDGSFGLAEGTSKTDKSRMRQANGDKKKDRSGNLKVRDDDEEEDISFMFDDDEDYYYDDEDETATDRDGKRKDSKSAKSRKKSRSKSKTKRDMDSYKDKRYYYDEELEEWVAEERQRVFGHDIFNNTNLSFEPNMNIATPDNYRLGPGDAVNVDIYGASQKTIQGTISPDGTLVIEGFGPVALSGLTVSQANARLRSQLGQRYSSSRVQLTVGQTKTIMVNVMGEVQAPGTYTLSAFASVFHALYMAGGPNDIGTLRAVKVYRDGRLLTTVDVYDYILVGKLTGNVMLSAGDVIVVEPYQSLVEIKGKVKRPMYYEMKTEETLADLVRFTGGFTGDAYTAKLRVERKTGGEYSIHTVGEFDLGSFKMHDKDAVTVDSVLGRYSNMVEVKGAVFRPGKYQYGRDVTTVRGLIEAAAGLREEAFPDHAVMHRRRPDRTLEALTVNLKGIMEGTEPDVLLTKDDILFVPTRKDMMEERTLTIQGEVNDPGTYAYAECETLEDLIIQAGGFTDVASFAKINVSRRIVNPLATRDDSVRAKNFSFSMRDGFVVDGIPGFILQPYDRVYVYRSPGTLSQEEVKVTGEAQFPGVYAIDRAQMRLSDLIAAAGGPTYKAYLRGARLIRRINPDERQRMLEVLQTAREQAEELKNQEQMEAEGQKSAIDYSAKLGKFELGDVYYVGIHLDEAMENPGGDEDIVLREGDELVLPEYINTVTVNGEVMRRNTVTYVEGKDYKYYVNKAGGFSLRAQKNRTYILYLNGTMSRVSEGRIEPGCEIIVPTKQNTRRRSAAEIMSFATGGASLATMAATIANLFKK